MKALITVKADMILKRKILDSMKAQGQFQIEIKGWLNPKAKRPPHLPGRFERGDCRFRAG
jgi:hypothetical protein